MRKGRAHKCLDLVKSPLATGRSQQVDKPSRSRDDDMRSAVHLAGLGDDVHAADNDRRLDGERNAEDVKLLGELESELPEKLRGEKRRGLCEQSRRREMLSR
jgi:hypothetical protein